MVYDPFDPLADYEHQMSLANVSPIDQYERDMNTAMGISNRKPPRFQPLNPVEESSMIDNLLGTGMSALQFVGGSIGKLGRAVRGGLGGKPEELLSAIPFSDTIGLTDKHGWFGDTALNMTDPSNQVEGRDLLESVGIAGKNQPGFADPVDAMEDVAGFMLGEALDPGNYVTGFSSAVGKGGKILEGLGLLPEGALGRITTNVGDVVSKLDPAKRAMAEAAAGKMGTTLDDVAGESAGGLFGFGAPFGNGASYIPGIAKGPLAEKIAGGLDEFGDVLRYGKIPGTEYSPGQHAAALFKAKSLGAMTPEIDPLAQTLHADSTAAIIANREKFAADALDRANRGFADDTTSDMLRGAMENTLDPVQLGTVAQPKSAAVPMMMTSAMRSKLQELGHSAEDIRNMNPQEAWNVIDAAAAGKKDAVQYARQVADEKYTPMVEEKFAQAKRVGAKVDELVDEAGVPYAPRQFVDEGPAGFGAGRRGYAKHWEGATDTLRKIISDPKVREFENLQEAADYMMQNYGHLYARAGDREEALLTLASKIRNQFSEKALATGGYATDMMKDMLDYSIGADLNIKSADFVAEAIAKHAKPLGNFSGTINPNLGGGRMPTSLSAETRRQLAKAGIGEAEIAGMHPAQAAEVLGKRGIKIADVAETSGKQMTVEDLLNQAGLEVHPEKIQYSGSSKLPRPEFDYETGALSNVMRKMKLDPSDVKLREQVAKMRVDERLAKDILGVGGSFTRPDAINKLLGVFDAAQGYFKAGVLAWPSRYVRDVTSGQYMSMATGNWSYRALADANSIIGGGIAKTAMEMPYVRQVLKARGLPMTTENASSVLKEVLYATEATSGSPRTLDAFKTPAKGAYAGGADQFFHEIPGTDPITAASIGKAGNSWNPLKVKGLGENSTTQFKPFAVSEEAGRYTDALNRVVPVIEQLRKGATPEQAKKVADAIQVSYNPRSYTKFERDVLKRLFPFYSYASRMIPEVLKQIARRPGGRLGISIKAANAARSDESFIPPYVGEGTAIPWPGNPNRFISQLGLPQDQLGDVFAFGSNPLETVRRTAQKVASMSSPVVKLPTEVATGTNLFTGRPIDETYQWPFADPILNEIVSNSPLARVSKGVRTLADTKELNSKGRKTLPVALSNLLSGVQITDVSGGIERQKELAARKIAQTLAKKNKSFRQHTNYYVPADTVLDSPEDVNLARLLKTMERSAKDAAKKEKRTRKLLPVDSVLP